MVVSTGWVPTHARLELSGGDEEEKLSGRVKGFIKDGFWAEVKVGCVWTVLQFNTALNFHCVSSSSLPGCFVGRKAPVQVVVGACLVCLSLNFTSHLKESTVA